MGTQMNADERGFLNHDPEAAPERAVIKPRTVSALVGLYLRFISRAPVSWLAASAEELQTQKACLDRGQATLPGRWLNGSL